MRRAVLVFALVCGCSRDAAHPPAARTAAAPPPARVSPFHELAPGIALAELERTYDEGIAEIDLVRLQVAALDFDVVRPQERQFAAVLLDESVDVAFNGGFFERDFSPSGLVVAGGVERSAANPRGGSGVLVLREGRAALVPFEQLGPLGEPAQQASLAVQCGPRLIELDGSIGIARDDGRRAARTALCLRDGGRTLDVVVARRRDGLRGPGLLTLATWLHEGLVDGEPGCESALNLDGGPSTALHVRQAPSARRMPRGPVVDAVIVRARGRTAP